MKKKNIEKRWIKLYGVWVNVFFIQQVEDVNYSSNLGLIEISVRAIKISVGDIQKVRHSKRRVEVDEYVT